MISWKKWFPSTRFAYSKFWPVGLNKLIDRGGHYGKEYNASPVSSLKLRKYTCMGSMSECSIPSPVSIFFRTHLSIFTAFRLYCYINFGTLVDYVTSNHISFFENPTEWQYFRQTNFLLFLCWTLSIQGLFFNRLPLLQKSFAFSS